MGITADLTGWKPEHILALAYITHGEASDDTAVYDLCGDVIGALEDAHDNDYRPSSVDVFEIRKEAYHHDCGNVDAFVAELEVLMQYAEITEPLIVHYSPNAEGDEAGSGWAVVSATCGLGGALWSNTQLMEDVVLLRAAARIYTHQALIMELPYVHHIPSEGHLLVVNDASKRVCVITPGHANRWYIRSASSVLAYATGSDGAIGPDFPTLVGALHYVVQMLGMATPVKLVRTREEFVEAIIADYVAGTENAFEYYKNAGYEVAEGESDLDFIRRAAEQDYEDGDGCAYADYLTKEV